MRKKKLILTSVAVGVAAALTLIPLGFNPGGNSKAEGGYNYTCPAGSYPIGDGNCKNEPTGCPWGDSIPKDSEKCAPPKNESEGSNGSSQNNNQGSTASKKEQSGGTTCSK